ncbi:hypothetical protein DOT_2639 [Desulfosporosinus sp. OT]|nr:hypothetical protein DOT_2639 [Desulfosporosinus sp. OT]
MGIIGGKISKLELWKNDSLMVNYDREWNKALHKGDWWFGI